MVRAGRDPLADKRALKDAPTVGETIDAYLASESFKVKAISTQRVDKGYRAAPATTTGQETRSLAQKRRHQANLQLIREGSTAKDEKTRKRGRARVTGGPGTTRMAIELLRSIFNWANVKPNPCDGVKTGSSGTRETILEDSDGYRRLFATLDRMETERRIRFAGCRCHTPHSAYGLSSGRSGGVALGECRFEAGGVSCCHRNHIRRGEKRVSHERSLCRQRRRKSLRGPADAADGTDAQATGTLGWRGRV